MMERGKKWKRGKGCNGHRADMRKKGERRERGETV